MSEVVPRFSAIKKVAEATDYIITPSNLLDVGALYLAYRERNNLENWKSIGLAALAFNIDNIDGFIARATATTSSLGEFIDATGDKFKMAMYLPHIYHEKLAPRPLVAAITIQNAANASLTVADAVINHGYRQIHPSKDGKHAMWLQSWGLGLNIIGHQHQKKFEQEGKAIRAAGTVLGAAGVYVGAKATRGYWQDATRAG
jgi:phosphatidylglycerophosphate synthase